MPKSHISERERILSEHGETEQIEFGRLRGNTNATNGSRRLSTSSSQSSSLSSTHLKYTYEPEIPNIEEVDETNIDQVLNFPSIAYIPQTFLTEIKQDALYETILEELNKKTSHFTKTHQQHQPQLSDITDDDDESYVYGEGGIIERNEDDMTDEYDTDIEQEQPVQEDHDFTGKSHYREVCDNLKIIPCKYFMAHIEDRELILRYHQFSTDDIRAIAKVMWSNINVEKLFLDGNYLQQAAAKYISRMIVTNDFITELSLADNRLGGGEGTKEICKMLTINRNLKKINLSGNSFNDIDSIQLVEAFEQNKTLRELDLSHNSLGEDCGKVLSTFISGNDSLEILDLSWNNIRGRSSVDIANGLKENVRLKKCNLEMNGFGPDGGQALGDCIKQNGALEELNISNNRLNTENAFTIGNGLLSNDSLQILKIANNQINCDGALAIFLCTKINESSTLREIDFSYTVVTNEAFEICQDLVNSRKNFRYLVGKITPDILKPNSISECYVKTNEDLLNSLRAKAKAKSSS